MAITARTTRAFSPNYKGNKELVYVTVGASPTKYALLLSPVSFVSLTNTGEYAMEFFSTNSNGEILAPVSFTDSDDGKALNFLNFSAAVTYSGYVPLTTDLIGLRSKTNKVLPISLISRIPTSGSPVSFTATNISAIVNTSNQRVFKLSGLSGTPSNPAGSTYTEGANTAIVRSWTQEGTTAIMTVESSLAYASTNDISFSLTPNTWSCAISIEDPNGAYTLRQNEIINEFSVSASIVSMNINDIGLYSMSYDDAGSLVDYDLASKLTNDKLKLRTNSLYASSSQIFIDSPSSVMKSKDIPLNSIRVYFDGIWHIIGRFAANSGITVASGNGANIEVTDNQNVTVPGTSASMAMTFNAEYSHLALNMLSNDLILKSYPAAMKIFFGDSNISVAPTTGIRLRKPSALYACKDSRPGIKIETTKAILKNYVVAEIDKPSAAKKLTVFSKYHANNISPIASQRKGEVGAIFQHPSNTQTQSSVEYNPASSAKIAKMEPYNGIVKYFSPSNKNISGENFYYNFMFKPCYNYLDHNGSASAPNDLSSNRWSCSSVPIKDTMDLLFGGSYGKFVIFAKRAGSNQSYRTSCSFSILQNKNLSSEYSNKITHLLSVGRGYAKPFGANSYAQWTDGARNLWWDGDSWNLRCIGGGQTYDGLGAKTRGNWEIDRITLPSGLFELRGDEYGTSILPSGNTTTDNSVFFRSQNEISTDITVLGGDSTYAANHTFIEPADVTAQQRRVPYIPHIAQLAITPSGQSYIDLKNSRPGRTDSDLLLGRYSYRWVDNRLNTGTTRTFTDNASKIWSVTQGYGGASTGFQTTTIHQPNTYTATWLWSKDIDFKDGRKVKIVLLPVDGDYSFGYNSGPNDAVVSCQKDRSATSAEAGKFNSYFQTLKDLDWEGTIVVPTQGTVTGNTNLVLNPNHDVTNIFSSMSAQSGLERGAAVVSNGLPAIISAKTERSLDLQFTECKAEYDVASGSTRGSKVTQGQSRNFYVKIKNNGTSSATIAIGDVKLYVVGTSEVFLRQNSAASTILAGGENEIYLSVAGNNIPSDVTGKRIARLKIVANGIPVEQDLYGDSGIWIQKSPALQVFTPHQNNYGGTIFSMFEDLNPSSVVTNIQSYVPLDSTRRQYRATSGHANVSWLAVIKHNGDVDTSDLSAASCVMTSGSSTWTQASLKDALDSTITTIQSGSFVKLYTNRATFSGSSTFAITCSYYDNGVAASLSIVSDTNGSWTRSANAHVLTTIDTPVSLSIDRNNANPNLVLSMSQDSGDCNFGSAYYVEENDDVSISHVYLKNSGTSTISNLSFALKFVRSSTVIEDPIISAPITADIPSNSSFHISGTWNSGDADNAYLAGQKDLWVYYNSTWVRDYNGAPCVLPTDSSLSRSKANPDALPIYFYGPISLNITGVTQLTNGNLQISATINTGLSNVVDIQALVNDKPVLVVNASSGFGYASDVPPNYSRAQAGYFAATNPLFNSNDFHWLSFPTTTATNHPIVFECNLRHYDFHGGRASSNGVLSYTDGLWSKSGNVKVGFKVKRNNAPFGSSLTEAQYKISYKKPVVTLPAQPSQTYSSVNASFAVPAAEAITVDLPQGYSAANPSVYLSEIPSSWIGVSLGTTASYTITKTNSWAGIYLKTTDVAGNSSYAFNVRPHDTDTPALNGAPSYVSTGSLAPKSGSSLIHLAFKEATDYAFADHYLTWRLNGADRTDIDLISGNKNNFTSLSGKWLSQTTSAYSCNFYDNAATPSPTRSGWSFYYLDGSTPYNITDDTLNPLVLDAELSQYVLACRTYWWDSYIESLTPIYINGFSQFSITLKSPVISSLLSSRRLNGRGKMVLDLLIDGVSRQTNVEIIDDGLWHNYRVDISPSWILTQGFIERTRIYFVSDNADEYIYAPVRPYREYRVANVSFRKSLAESDLYVTEVNLGAPLDGDDYIQIGGRVKDYAGNTAQAWNANLIYVRPLEPTAVNIRHARSNDGFLRGKIYSITTSEFSISVLYRIGYYKEGQTEADAVFMAGGTYKTKSQWEAGTAWTEPLEEGKTYKFFAIAYNPNDIGSPNLVNGSRITTDFYSGWIMGVPYDSTHHTYALHDNLGNYHDNDTNRAKLTFGQQVHDYADLVSSNGLHFSSEWNPKPLLTKFSTSFLSGSTDKTYQIRLENFRKTGDSVYDTYPVEGYCYSTTYGATSKFSQPDTTSVASVSSGYNVISVNIDPTYRGYCYAHIRPYYTIGSTKYLFDQKYTLHVAIYTEYADGLPQIDSIVSATAAGYVDGAPPNWNGAIYSLRVVPELVNGIYDDSLIEPIEKEQKIQYRAKAKKVGTSSVVTGSWNGYWSLKTDGDLPQNYIPLVNGLLESTRYDCAAEAVSEGGALGNASPYGYLAYTNIRVAPDVDHVYPSGDYGIVRFAKIFAEPPSGNYIFYNHLKNTEMEIKSYSSMSGFWNASTSRYECPIRMSAGEAAGLIVKSTNPDGVTISPYPFDHRIDSTWKPTIFSYMHMLDAPSISVLIGYRTDGSRYFRLLPSDSNEDTKKIYTGSKLESDGGAQTTVNNICKYGIEVWSKDPETKLGYLNVDTRSVSPTLVLYTRDYLIATAQHFDVTDLTKQYGFKMICGKSTDFGTYTVIDFPQGDEYIYSDWSTMVWSYAYPKSYDDYADNLHLYTKLDYDSGTTCYNDAFQDVVGNFDTLKDLRISYKILASETTDLDRYPDETSGLSGPDVSFSVLITAMVGSAEYNCGVVLYNNKIKDGSWHGTDYGVNVNQYVSIHDKFGPIQFSSDSPMREDWWYHASYDVYSQILALLKTNTLSWSDVDRVRIRVFLSNTRGQIYGNSDLGKEYDEGQIGVLVRNISIGWREQIDQFGRKLYSEDSWNGNYLWQTANFSMKKNPAAEGYTSQEINLPQISQQQYLEKIGPWNPSNTWYYNNYVKNLMPDKKSRNWIGSLNP